MSAAGFLSCTDSDYGIPWLSGSLPTQLASPEAMPIPAKILCVDDEPDLLEVRRILLEKAGYNVVVARTGEQGIRLFSAEQFDLVVLDYWMADMDGLTLAQELKRIKSKVPLVMFSGYHSILDEAIGRVDKWLVKGQGEPKDLLSAITELLSRAGNASA
jgi:DNA-binding response OmpR family regulator